MMKSFLIIIFGLLIASSPAAKAQIECTADLPDGLQPIAAFSIFQSNYKNKDYDFALKYGRWILCNKPTEVEGINSFDLSLQLDKFTKIYSSIAETKEDPSERATYLDSAIMVYNDKLLLYKDDKEELYSTRQNMSRFYLQNTSYLTDAVPQAYAQFQIMFDLNPEKTTNSAKGYYIDNLLRNYINKGETAKAQAIINEASKYATGNVVDILNNYQKDLFDSPDDVIAYYQPVLEEDANNIEALKALESAYEELDNRDELAKVRMKLHEVQPTYESAKALAQTEESNAQYGLAIKYYKEALEMATTDEQKKQTNLSISSAYINNNDIRTADRYVDAAIKLDPNFGQAYINKARIYATAVTKCTEDRKLEAKDRMVYWLVIDYLNMAKAKDPSVASNVNSQLPNYTRVTPTGEDKFLRLDNLKDGQKVKIDGSVDACYSWINKTTTVR